MTQQQKQRERPKQAPRNVGEIVIATLDLLLSLPLIFVLIKAFQSRPPEGLETWFSASLLFVIAFGLMSAGLLLGIRQQKLARSCQWIAALGAIIFMTMQVVQIWPHIATLWITCILYVIVALILSTLALLLQKLKED
jgi:hypothetical protein